MFRDIGHRLGEIFRPKVYIVDETSIGSRELAPVVFERTRTIKDKSEPDFYLNQGNFTMCVSFSLYNALEHKMFYDRIDAINTIDPLQLHRQIVRSDGLESNGMLNAYGIGQILNEVRVRIAPLGLYIKMARTGKELVDGLKNGDRAVVVDVARKHAVAVSGFVGLGFNSLNVIDSLQGRDSIDVAKFFGPLNGPIFGAFLITNTKPVEQSVDKSPMRLVVPGYTDR